MKGYGGEATFRCYSLVIHKDGIFQLVSTKEELRALFAPIESADEALSYALLVTEYHARYDPPAYHSGPCAPGGLVDNLILVEVIEDTHVVEIEDGYEVYLFGEEKFGCGSHPVWSVPVQVKHDGTITEGPRVKLYELYLIDCCID